MSVSGVREDDGARLTIEEMAGITGVKAGLLRSWESEFEFPLPHRAADGTRRYRPDQARAVLRVLRRREDGMPLAGAIGEALAAHAAGSPSVFATVTRLRPELRVQRLRKQTLVHVSHAIEDECLEEGDAPLFFGAFQTEQHYLPSQLRWTRIAEHARATVVIGGYPGLIEHRGTAAPVLVPLDPRAALRREWVVVCESAERNAVLAAREVPAAHPVADRDRCFDAVWSVDPGTVRAAARICAQVGAEAGSVTGESLLEELRGPPLSCRDIADAAGALFSRILAYTDRATAP